MRSIPRTVAFYEIVRAKDSINQRMEKCNWQEKLAGVLVMPGTERLLLSLDGNLFGESVEVDGKLHLQIGKIGESSLQTVDLDSLRIEELRLEGNKGTIDTTVVSFLDYGNVIGIMQGRPGAPRASGIQKWLNSRMGLTDEIKLWPVISKGVWEKLQNAVAVHSFEFSYAPSPHSLSPSDMGLSSYAQLGRERYPDSKVTIQVAVPRKPGSLSSVARARAQRRLRTDVDEFLSEIGYLEAPGIDRARALVTTSMPDGSHKDENLDFLSHHITAKVRVELRRGERRPAHEQAVRAIIDAAMLNEPELRAAVSGPD